LRKKDGSENVLDIPLTAILAKMAEEMNKAQSSQNVQQIREHAAVIRVLCDLILDRPNERQNADITSTDEFVKPIQISSVSNERIDIGDDANGASLFDF
jgi:tRNA A37 methylthiotransferase MiaB